MKIEKIQVYGSGCPTCKQIHETVKKIAKELGINNKVEYIADVAKMVELGVMTSPAVVVDGKIVLTGAGHSEENIKEALSQSLASDNGAETGSSCGGSCTGCDC